MNLRLFNTATGKVETIQPRDGGKLSFYACGPTVYDYPHIGHGRMVLTYDVLRRYVESRGVQVHHVSNITDIEDKIIGRAKQRNVATTEITQTYEAEWYKAMDRLGVLRPHEDPHATAYVEQMVELIGKLIENGAAYETSDTIYFSPEKIADYGMLARQSLTSLRAGARVEADEQKRSPIDFALWKKIPAERASELEPVWPSPWGSGRPGWHTECVVMSLDLLGEGFDIHGGGQDLAFPHHENERAQAVAAGKTFARHWMHNGFVEMGGIKMSKSLGNFTNLTDLLDRTDPRAYRLLVLRAHYRSPLEVTPETIADAQSAIGRLDDFARRFNKLDDVQPVRSNIDAFNERMDDDLDTPRAISDVFSLVREANTAMDAGDTQGARSIAKSVITICESVGLTFAGEEQIDSQTRALMDQRDMARQAKDWAKADALRDHLVELGWTVEDSATGTNVHR